MRSGQEAALTSAHVRRFVVRLVAGILAGVGGTLGAVFLVLGLAGTGEETDGMAALGAGALAVALACLLVLAVVGLRARGAEERERTRRSARVSALVQDVRYKPYTRIGSTVTLVVTVRLPLPGGPRDVARTLHVSPLTRIAPGGRMAVAYDPDRPHDFMPLLP